MLKALIHQEDLPIKKSSLENHSEAYKGEVYTRPHVVNFMLTSIGLTENIAKNDIRILEPCCGQGEFVIAIAKYLIKGRPSIDQLTEKLLAIDLVSESLEVAKAKIHKLFTDNKYSESDIKRLLESWFLETDFLLEDIPPNFTHIIGNPPYVRVEKIPKNTLSKYRDKFSTMTERADLYIPFYEKALSLLVKNGKLSFICTDRWTKNSYGKSLRQMISDDYSLELYIGLQSINSFHKNVLTYPAITQIKKSKGNKTVLLHELSFTHEENNEIKKAINEKPSNIKIRKNIINGSKPWLLGSVEEVTLIQCLEKKYPSLEASGCKVFIGAATGANNVYIVDKQAVDIEESRLLPVITARELRKGSIKWSGQYIINTYDNHGLIDLNDFPKLSKYLNTHREQLSKRHVAKKNIRKWFKTIDRVYEERLQVEKLLIPDISNETTVIHDSGSYHPNNSIYYICSDEWNLQALRVVLLSDVTKLFISTYSTKIANGYLRFQAQHLRKLRIPAWGEINDDLKERFIAASVHNNREIFTELTCEMYCLTQKQKSIFGI